MRIKFKYSGSSFHEILSNFFLGDQDFHLIDFNNLRLVIKFPIIGSNETFRSCKQITFCHLNLTESTIPKKVAKAKNGQRDVRSNECTP
jgi:hypothetical protein